MQLSATGSLQCIQTKGIMGGIGGNLSPTSPRGRACLVGTLSVVTGYEQWTK